MEEWNKLSEVIGFWYGAHVLCPFCFERQGRVDHEGIIPSCDLIGLLTKCFICDLPLWEIQRQRRMERRFKSTHPHRHRRSGQALESRIA